MSHQTVGEQRGDEAECKHGPRGRKCPRFRDQPTLPATDPVELLPTCAVVPTPLFTGSLPGTGLMANLG